MTRWDHVEAASSRFAGRVRARFDEGVTKTIATIRRDGSPRISGIEVRFAGGEILIGMMPKSRKLADVLRDPRVALHSATLQRRGDPWVSDAKISGVLQPRDPVAGEGPADATYFRLSIASVAHTALAHTGDRILIESWTPEHGYVLRSRT